jgi:hypothetical protein
MPGQKSIYETFLVIAPSLPLDGSVTINVKTTVHCSPGPSMDDCCDDLGIELDAVTSRLDLFRTRLDLIRVSFVVDGITVAPASPVVPSFCFGFICRRTNKVNLRILLK